MFDACASRADCSLKGATIVGGEGNRVSAYATLVKPRERRCKRAVERGGIWVDG